MQQIAVIVALVVGLVTGMAANLHAAEVETLVSCAMMADVQIDGIGTDSIHAVITGANDNVGRAYNCIQRNLAALRITEVKVTRSAEKVTLTFNLQRSRAEPCSK